MSCYLSSGRKKGGQHCAIKSKCGPKVYGGKRIQMFQKETDTKSNKTQGIGKTYREIIYVIK
jgi:hypothetical protein